MINPQRGRHYLLKKKTQHKTKPKGKYTYSFGYFLAQFLRCYYNGNLWKSTPENKR